MAAPDRPVPAPRRSAGRRRPARTTSTGPPATPGTRRRPWPGWPRPPGPSVLDRAAELAGGTARRPRHPARAGTRQAGQGRPRRDRPGGRHAGGLRGRGPPDRRRAAAGGGLGPRRREHRADLPGTRREWRWPSRRSTPRRTCSRTSSARRSPPGTRTIVKAPPQAPASSAAVVELLLDAGMPAEAVQLLHGGRRDRRPAVRGGRGRGDQLHRQRGDRRRGGARRRGASGWCSSWAATRPPSSARTRTSAPAAAVCARTGYSNSGQSCISVQRVYVQRERFGAFLDAFTAEVADAAHRRPAGRGDRRRVDGRRGGGRAGGPLGGARRRRTAPRWCSAGPATAPPWPRPWWRTRRPRPRSSPARCSARWWPCCPTTASAR